jgi:SAM-dependent methyltransferase
MEGIHLQRLGKTHRYSEPIDRMTTRVNHWLAYQKRWEFKGTAEEAIIFSGSHGGYESRMQHDFMLAQGLRSQHRFLDVGCGALRGTIRLVDYLENGHFYGGDISVGLLKEALIECGRLQLKNLPLLQLMDSFDLKSLFGEEFDFILCNSVTVHIEPDDIQELCHGIALVLKQIGKAFISVYPLEETASEPHHWDGYRWWYKRSWMAQEAAKGGLNLSDIPGRLMNRIPGQKKCIIPIVNTNMTEWMMEGTR